MAPKIKHRGVEPAGSDDVSETVDQSFPIPGFGVTHALNDRWSVGLGVCAPFGLGVEWENPETWVGRFTSYDVDLQTIYVSPAVSFRVSPQVAVAVGADIAWQHIELNRYVGAQFGGQSEWVNAIDVQLSGTSDLNVTPTIGVMARPTREALARRDVPPREDHELRGRRRHAHQRGAGGPRRGGRPADRGPRRHVLRR